MRVGSDRAHDFDDLMLHELFGITSDVSLGAAFGAFLGYVYHLGPSFWTGEVHHTGATLQSLLAL